MFGSFLTGKYREAAPARHGSQTERHRRKAYVDMIIVSRIFVDIL